jgi:hypothetical protein
MKKLQVMISDELMRKAKVYAFDNETTLKDLVTSLLEQHFSKTPTRQTKTPTQPVQKQEHLYHKTPTVEEIMNQPDNNHFILRKTHQTSNPLTEGYRYQNGSFVWVVLPDCKIHYDINGDIIPYRFTGPDGTVYEPDEEEIQELEEHFGKKVKIEE